jgi:hypothetical protein
MLNPLPWLPKEDEQVLSELRGLLMDANDSGKLPEVLKESLGKMSGRWGGRRVKNLNTFIFADRSIDR